MPTDGTEAARAANRASDASQSSQTATPMADGCQPASPEAAIITDALCQGVGAILHGASPHHDHGQLGSPLLIKLDSTVALAIGQRLVPCPQ